MSNVVDAPIHPKFYCEEHGPTNHVLELFNQGCYCTPCLCRALTNHGVPTVKRYRSTLPTTVAELPDVIA